MTVKNFFTAQRLVHFSLLVAAVLFFVVTLVVDMGLFRREMAQYPSILVLLAVLVLFEILAGRIVTRTLMRRIRPEQPFAAKVRRWGSVNIIRWAILDAAVLMSIVLHMLTRDNTLFFLLAIVVLIYLLNAPTKMLAIKDLELTEKEIGLLGNPDTPLEVDQGSTL